MIVAVKNSNSSNKFKKIVSFLVVIAMFVAYYFHMSEEFSQDNETKKANEQVVQEDTKTTKAKEIEQLIYREIETAVDLVGQQYIQDVKLVKDKILIVCDTSTNLEPLKVRYGTLALIKNDLNNIKIAIDIKFIVESKLNEKNSK